MSRYPSSAAEFHATEAGQARTRACVRLDRLRRNTAALRAYAGDAPLMAIVKSEAYGHGALPATRALAEEGVRWFGVATADEALSLRKAGVSERMLILTSVPPERLPAASDLDLDVTVSSPESADAVLACGDRPFRVHVKADTGMGRIGISPERVPRVVHRLEQAAHVRIAGLWTHLATAYSDAAFARRQLERFDRIVAEAGDAAETIHVTATGSLLRFPEALSWDRSVARAGIGLYGYAGLEADYGLRPAMSLWSKVTQLKKIPAGTSVSYGRTWTANRDTFVATVGAGYADGYPRMLGNRASVAIRGERYPVVGAVCMNMFMVDAGPEPRIAEGDDVLLFGADKNQAGNGPDAADLAAWTESIPHEILTRVPDRVPRIYLP